MVDERVRKRRATSRGSTASGSYGNERRVSPWALIIVMIGIFMLGVYVGGRS